PAVLTPPLPPPPTRRSSDLSVDHEAAADAAHRPAQVEHVAHPAGHTEARLGHRAHARIVAHGHGHPKHVAEAMRELLAPPAQRRDRKSTRLNSSHVKISYAV